MNTRLQVEHVVTEMITGLDLVEWQIRVAAGEPLPMTQDAIVRRGHAIEARLYAEDPARDYLPSAGLLGVLRFPPESEGLLRVETGFRPGDRVSPYYDALIAKLIAWGETREVALTRLRAALAETRVAGVASNRELLQHILADPDFAAQGGDTGFIARHHDALLPSGTPRAAFVAAALSILDEPPRPAADPHSPWQLHDGWRLGSATAAVFRFHAADKMHEVCVTGQDRCTVDGEPAAAPGDVVVTRNRQRVLGRAARRDRAARVHRPAGGGRARRGERRQDRRADAGQSDGGAGQPGRGGDTRRAADADRGDEDGACSRRARRRHGRRDPFLYWRASRRGRRTVDAARSEVRMIRKLKTGEYQLYSRKLNPKTGKRRNLGTFTSRAAAEKHERDVQYFKRH